MSYSIIIHVGKQCVWTLISRNTTYSEPNCSIIHKRYMVLGWLEVSEGVNSGVVATCSGSAVIALKFDANLDAARFLHHIM